MTGLNILLVEGTDDEKFVEALLAAHNMKGNFHIKVKGGAPNLLRTLRVELQEAELGSLGVIIDADVSATDRWRSVQGILTNASSPGIPAEPKADGTVISAQGKASVGVWIMPDNSSAGMLEDFAASLTTPHDPLLPRAKQCVEAIPLDQRRFGDKQSKAIIHTWLAWQEEPGVKMGAAITRRYFDENAAAATAFISWLQSLAAAAIDPE